jgi:hypothetical protein
VYVGIRSVAKCHTYFTIIVVVYIHESHPVAVQFSVMSDVIRVHSVLCIQTD